MIKALITVHYKQGILDPQGKAVQHALKSLSVNGVADARVGKHIILTFPELTREEADEQTKKACEKILSNPVIEDFEYELVEAKS